MHKPGIFICTTFNGHLQWYLKIIHFGLGDHPITGGAELVYNKILRDHRKNQVVNLGDRH